MTSSILRYAILVTIALALPASTTASIKTVQENYLPLSSDNYWVYAQPNDLLTTITVRVVGRAENQAFLVENYCFCLDGPRPGRHVTKMLSTYTEACEVNGDEVGIWYRWTEADGSSVTLPNWGSDCMHGAAGAMFGTGTVGVPAGTFDGTKTVIYDEVRCRDQLPIQETFAPGIGLIMRVLMVDDVTQTWVLTEAQVNGVLFVMDEGRAGGPSVSPEPNQETTWGAVKSIFAE